ncbi:uroporphyrinogen-III C-methyltransferase [Pontibacter sp. G13]|uniref:uroporphyrinogen-III C-methyltransferase n=1 Tax=Pontibacter sp. G13 TaxID=3074898 RepID=UPI002888FC50|nr:uroporphyrinogen-III C-methyltransferase [Pontibacter sp. G13]WNJ17838.1 uroporphyrinogen-III C-methyltransferase [Pontibacter sp. G13]
MTLRTTPFESTPQSSASSSLSTPRITLVGAGPGDPELITLKGVKALQSADVVLYDALANPALLEYLPRNAKRIFVGKRADRHRFSQQEIQFLMVEHAYQHGHVVRLKGGDPFIFGRGYEELEFAKACDIPVEIIPGISSSTSLPGLEQVPLTCRGINESFWVVTGTTQDLALSKDLELAAQSSATVVILMGIRRIREITQVFADHGQSDTPAMVIQHGSLPNKRSVVGTVHTLADQVIAEKIGTPGIIVIGETVGLHPAFQSARKRIIQQMIQS